MQWIWNSRPIAMFALGIVTWVGVDRPVAAADWPMLGRDGTRNAVSPERNPPTSWDIGTSIDDAGNMKVERTSTGIQWFAKLGEFTHSSPVISDGLVWIGTSKLVSDGPKRVTASVLKCFSVADGKEVYEYVSPMRGTRHHDPVWTGLGSSPLIEGDHLWIATNRSEVVSMDIGPLIRGEGPPVERWKLDLMDRFDTSPHVPSMGPPRPCSIGPSWNDRIFVTINNGIGEDHQSVPKPDAPSLVCLNKNTGDVIWTDNSPGANILVTQFSSPTVAEVAGKVQVIVPQSDGWLRAFDPETGAKLWEFDVNPKLSVYRLGGRSNRNSLLGNAVVYDGRVYLASGMDAEKGEGPGRLVCIDPTKRGDVSSELAVDASGMLLPQRRLQAVDSNAGEMAIPNPNSALVWEFVNCGRQFPDAIYRTMGSIVAANGLVIVADIAGLVHCFDAKTGQRYWRHDLESAIWASPLIVDDKAYIGTEEGQTAIFGVSSDPTIALRKVNGKSEPLSSLPTGALIYSTPTYANGVLYVATRSMLVAIPAEKSVAGVKPTKGDWPMLGRDATRNNAVADGIGPSSWEVEQRQGDRVTTATRGIRWTAKLGTAAYASPVVSGGLVWIGTNNVRPGKGNLTEYSSVLKCFRLRDGEPVYEYVSPKLPNRIQDPGWGGLGGSPMIEGERLWLTTNRCEVLCLDIGPLIREEGAPKELWKVDLLKQFDVFIHQPLMGPPCHCSIGASWNGRIYVTINNGVDESRTKVPNPDAPSLVCLNQENGDVFWKDNSPGSNILLTQMVSPTVATIGDAVQVIVPQSDGWIRAFNPETGKILWEFDINFKTSSFIGHRSTRNSLAACAVVDENRVYIASGWDIEHGDGPGRLVCFDPTRRGDISSELAVDADGKQLPRRRLQAVIPKAGEKAIPNPNSGLLWEFVSVGQKRLFQDVMHRTRSSVAIAKGLVFATDISGLVHCLDSTSGKRYWSYDSLNDSIVASPLILGDRVYVADQDGRVLILRLSSEPHEPLAEIHMGASIHTAPIFADDTLLIATNSTLFAIGDREGEKRNEKTAEGSRPKWRGPPDAPAVVLPVVPSAIPKAKANDPEKKDRGPNAIFVPTPHDVVDKMLTEVNVSKDDVVYDLGSGDGRIVIEAARKYQCRAVGLENDRELVKQSRENTRTAKLDQLVTIKESNLFEADFGDASVVVVYLFPHLLERLKDKFNKLKPGTRIVSHQFEIPNVKPEKTIIMESTETGAKHTIHVWTIPPTRSP